MQANRFGQVLNLKRTPITHFMGWDRCVSYLVSLKPACLPAGKACKEAAVMGRRRKS